MKSEIDFYDYPRAKFGWTHLQKLTEHLGRGDFKITLIYFFNTNELLIIDKKLIEILKTLKIPYEYSDPSSSIRFIKSLKKTKGN